MTKGLAEASQQQAHNAQQCENLTSTFILIKLLPSQISATWDVLSPVVLEAMPDYIQRNHTMLNNILHACLEDSMQCWVLVGPAEGDESPIHAVVITTISEDVVLGVRNLIVYALGTFGDNKQFIEMARSGLKTLKDYARGMGCYRVTGYVPRDSAAIYERFLDAEVNYIAVEWGV